MKTAIVWDIADHNFKRTEENDEPQEVQAARAQIGSLYLLERLRAQPAKDLAKVALRRLRALLSGPRRAR